MNTNLHAAIGILSTDAVGLTRYLEEQATENPHLQLISTPPLPGDWLPRWHGVFSSGEGNISDIDLTPAAPPSLVAHVLQAIDVMRLSAPACRIAEALVEALEPSGWLGRSVGAVAKECGATPTEVELVLVQLQGIEPAGLFARNLAECLRLQAKDAGVLDHLMVAVLDHLPILATGDVIRLAQACNASHAEVSARFRIIRGMNPKPGTIFIGPGGAPPLREPDLIARILPEGRGWQISLNRSALPSVQVARVKGGDATALRAAHGLKQAVEARNTTLLRVGVAIATCQAGALMHGPVALAPMTMAKLGVELDLHESTISRVVTASAMDTPRGTWWLRRMFSGARGGEGGIPVQSTAALRARLSRLIATEDPRHPLTDDALVSALAIETGITLPRRTVAQYRDTEGIPPRHRRKR